MAIVHDPSVLDPIGSIWEPLLQHWPASNHPRVVPLTIEQVLGMTQGQSAGWGAVVVDGSIPESADLYKLLDVLQQGLIPTLTLGDDEARLSAGGGSQIALHDRTEPTLAAILFALTQRQSVVRALDRHLAMAQSFQGEAVAEIDRLHDELLLAAKVQRDFMPKELPTVDELELSVIFRPASFVSGDIYDLFRISDDEVGFFLADAMGHGVPAALMTLFIASHMPRPAIGSNRPIPGPAEALAALSRELHASRGGPTRFATAVAGTIDLRTRTVRIAAAGHPPPLIVGPDGIRPVDASGMLLGVIHDAAYEELEFQLEPGESLILHSDGVETAFRKDQCLKPNMVYMEHFARLAAEPGVPLNIPTRTLARKLDEQTGSINAADDITILVIRAVPDSGIRANAA